MNKKFEQNESSAHKEFAKLLDDSMQAIEDTLNNDIVVQLRNHDTKIKDLSFLKD
jgi:hypothetical protein